MGPMPAGRGAMPARSSIHDLAPMGTVTASRSRRSRSAPIRPARPSWAGRGTWSSRSTARGTARSRPATTSCGCPWDGQPAGEPEPLATELLAGRRRGCSRSTGRSGCRGGRSVVCVGRQGGLHIFDRPQSIASGPMLAVSSLAGARPAVEASMTEFYPWFVFTHLAGLVPSPSATGRPRRRSACDPHRMCRPRAPFSDSGAFPRSARCTSVCCCLSSEGSGPRIANLWAGPGSSPRSSCSSRSCSSWAVASPYYMSLRKSVVGGPPNGRAATGRVGGPPWTTRQPPARHPPQHGNHRAALARLVDGDQAGRVGAAPHR